MADQIHIKFQDALNFYRQGNLPEAKKRVDKILRSVPNHFDSLNLAGLISYHIGSFAEADRIFSRAIRLRSDFAPLYLNYGLTLHMLKRYGEALENYDKAILIRSDYSVAFYNRANVFKDLKYFDAALENYDKAISIKQNFPEALYGRGVTLSEMMRYEDALESFDKAISFKSDFADAFNNRGVTLSEMKRYDDALKSFDKAILFRSDFADAFNNRGVLLFQLRRFDDALKCFDNAISIRLDFADAFNNRGLVLVELHKLSDALESFDKAIAINSDYAEALYNRGNALQKLRRFDEAVINYDKAIAIKPNYADAFNNRAISLQAINKFNEAHENYKQAIVVKSDFAEAFNNLGTLFQGMRRFDEAFLNFDKAISTNSNYFEPQFNKAVLNLLLGDFSTGFHSYEVRKLTRAPSGNRNYSKPLWLGAEIGRDKAILIHHEQGLGDTIQFCRYVPMLAEMGVKVLFAPQYNLRRIISTLGDNFEIVDADDNSLDFNFHCPLLSLPLALKTTLATIPNRIPYLAAEPSLLIKWKRLLGEIGYKIAICWQGSTGNLDVGRSFSVENFELISMVPGVRLISIHKGEGENQLRNLTDRLVVETLGADFDVGSDAFVDTAAIIKCCDLVITSDTAVAHLAGALGVKTWLALKHVPDWRWMLDRSNSPWYPTMKLFRQKTPGDWTSVFYEMRLELTNLIEHGAHTSNL